MTALLLEEPDERYLKVPVAAITVNHERMREGVGDSKDSQLKFDELKDSMARLGQLEPIIITAEYELVAGFRRLSAARALGWQTITAALHDNLDEITRRMMELEENIIRHQMSWDEEQRAIAILDSLKREQDPNWTQAQTGQLVGKPQARVSTAIKITRALDVFPELKKAKNLSQALSWAEQRSRNIMRVQEVAEREDEYLEIEQKVILGDSREVILTIPDGSIDAVITDPPFGINYGDRVDNTIGTTSAYEDDERTYRTLLGMAPELYRVIKADGWLVWFLGISWYEEAKDTFRKAGFTVDEIPIIWDRSDGKTFTSRPDRWFTRGYDIALHAIKGNPQMVKRGHPNIFRVPPVPSSERELLVERPVELYQEIIRHLTVPGELVVDFFCGSGSCPAAAASLGRDYLTVELSPERRARAIQKIKSYTPER